jgi:MTH538 TIR-like domain (DUF1863)
LARKVFYSFHYQLDSWRVQTVMNMGQVEGQPLLGSQSWEDVAKGGDRAIEAWIDEQMKGKSCNVVLIGSQTAGRKWVNYEFRKAWADGKGVVGVYIHKLLDRDGNVAQKGANPFSGFTVGEGSKKKPFDQVVKAYNPNGLTSKEVYGTIAANITDWIEEAIDIRGKW